MLKKPLFINNIKLITYTERCQNERQKTKRTEKGKVQAGP